MTNELDLGELVDALAGVARGDRAAMRRLYAATSAKLYGVCLRILRDGSEAEEVLQDAYMVVWRRASAYDPARGAPMTWLVTVTRNRALDRLRSRKALHTAPLEPTHEPVDPAPAADAAMVADEDSRRLQACLDDLDPRTAAAIRAAFEQGLTYEALAHAHGVPVGTMKSWIRRGLLKMRSSYAP